MGSSQGVIPCRCQGQQAIGEESEDKDMEPARPVEPEPLSMSPQPRGPDTPRGLSTREPPSPFQSAMDSEVVVPTPRGDGALLPYPDDSAAEDIIREWRRNREALNATLADLSAKLRVQDQLAEKLLSRSQDPRASTSSRSAAATPPEGEGSGQKMGEPDHVGQPRAPSKTSEPTTSTQSRLAKPKPRWERSSTLSMLEGEDCFRRMLVRVYKSATRFRNLPEPDREGRLADFVHSKYLELIVMAMIFASVAFTIWSTNDAAARIRNEKWGDSEGSATVLEMTLYVELGFCILFSLELAVRMAVHRCFFFINENWGWNWFDFLLLVAAVANLIYDQFIGYSIGNVTFVRAFRLLKVTRILRLLRVVKFFRKLSQVLDALLASIRAVAWVALPLLSLFLAFAMIFVQLVSQYLTQTDALNGCRIYDCECDMSPLSTSTCTTTEALVHYFGSVQRAMISLYMATTGGLDWTNLWDVILKTGYWNAVFFLLFTFLFIFCVFNLLTGMFVNQVLNTAQRDKDLKIIEQREKEKEKVLQLENICKEADKDNDGTISSHEFNEMMENSNVLFWLASIGLDIADARLFFDMMQKISGTGEDKAAVPIELFVQGCMRMKGGATSIDVQVLMYKVQLIMERQKELSTQVARL